MSRRVLALLVVAWFAACRDADDERDAWVVSSRDGIFYAKIVAATGPAVDTATAMRCGLEGDEVLWRSEVPSGGDWMITEGHGLIRVDVDARGDEPAVLVYHDGGLVGAYPRTDLAKRGIGGRFTATVDPYHYGEIALHVVDVASGAECHLDLRGSYR